MELFTKMLGICVVVLTLIGCSVSGQSSPETGASGAVGTPAASHTLTREGDKLVDTDLGADVFDGSGLKITIDITAKTARIQLVDPNSGQDFSDYYVFDYNNQTMVNHRFVSMRQMEYDYTLDLTSGELVAVIDGEGNDAIETLRKMDRFDKAQSDRAQERTDLEAWFQERYGVTIREAAAA